MINFSKSIRLIVILILVFGFFGIPCQTQIVVDHTCTDISKIPDSWIDQVKNMLVLYTGASHARQVPLGLLLLEAQNAKYQVQLSADPTRGGSDYDDFGLVALTETGALRVLRSQRDIQYNGWTLLNFEYGYWATEFGRSTSEITAAYCIQQGQPLTISLWCWSWDLNPVFGFSVDESGNPTTFDDSRRDAYLNAITRFNANSEINQTRFVYSTIVSDYNADEWGWNATRYNQDIRNHVKEHGEILFDQADIENWNQAGTSQQVYQWNGNTLYLRHPDWDESVLPDTYTGDHANDALDIQKAKAFWWLLARIKGWDGKSDSHVDGWEIQ